jgi:cell division protein FtsW (lipid II flippase)
MIIPILLIIFFGVTVIYSSSPPLAIQQALYAALGLIGYFLLRRFDYRSVTPKKIISRIGIIIKESYKEKKN